MASFTLLIISIPFYWLKQISNSNLLMLSKNLINGTDAFYMIFKFFIFVGMDWNFFLSNFMIFYSLFS